MGDDLDDKPTPMHVTHDSVEGHEYRPVRKASPISDIRVDEDKSERPIAEDDEERQISAPASSISSSNSGKEPVHAYHPENQTKIGRSKLQLQGPPCNGFTQAMASDSSECALRS